jgi:hypothetical protein
MRLTIIMILILGIAIIHHAANGNVLIALSLGLSIYFAIENIWLRIKDGNATRLRKVVSKMTTDEFAEISAREEDK